MDMTTKEAVTIVAKELAKGTVLDLTMRVGVVIGAVGAAAAYGAFMNFQESRAKNAQKD